MTNCIIRPLANNLGFDGFGQLWAITEEHGLEVGRIVHDLRDQNCCICGTGWKLTPEAYLDSYREGAVERSMHLTCYKGHLMLKWAVEFYEAIAVHALKWSWQQISNEYGGAWNLPWYKVKFDGYFPTLKFGWRKRVINMELLDLTAEQTAFIGKLLETVTSTKAVGDGQAMVHACGMDEFRKYLGGFIQTIKLDQPKPELAE